MAANGRQAYHVTRPTTIPTWIFPASTFVWIFCSPPSLVQSGPLLFLGSKKPPSMPFHLVPNQLPQTLTPTRAHPASSADRDPEPVCKRKKRGRHQVSQVRQASGSNRTKTSFFRISGNFKTIFYFHYCGFRFVNIYVDFARFLICQPFVTRFFFASPFPQHITSLDQFQRPHKNTFSFDLTSPLKFPHFQTFYRTILHL